MPPDCALTTTRNRPPVLSRDPSAVSSRLTRLPVRWRPSSCVFGCKIQRLIFADCHAGSGEKRRKKSLASSVHRHSHLFIGDGARVLVLAATGGQLIWTFSPPRGGSWRFGPGLSQEASRCPASFGSQQGKNGDREAYMKLQDALAFGLPGPPLAQLF